MSLFRAVPGGSLTEVLAFQPRAALRPGSARCCVRFWNFIELPEPDLTELASSWLTVEGDQSSLPDSLSLPSFPRAFARA